MAGHIHDLADKIQAGHFFTFHRFSGEFVGVDAARSDLSLLVPLSPGRDDPPVVNLPLKFRQC